MMGLLQRVFRKGRHEELGYEQSKALAASPSSTQRRRVAVNQGARPEILYFLAADPDPQVRAAIAANEATPVQADLLLAADGDDAVRQDLARKIGRLAPGLNADETDRLRQMTYEVLETLVRDQLPLVRSIIAEALQDRSDAPPDIVRHLAGDSEILVAGPILRFSPLLTDADLLSIIAAGAPGALAAVATRKGVSAQVSDAIGSGADIDAVTALLGNPTAQIREATLDRLIERAREVKPWHKPLVERPTLSAGAIKKLAVFVARDLIDRLKRRHDIDPATANELTQIVGRRLDLDVENRASGKPKDERAALYELHAAGKLDDDVVLKACAGDRDLACVTLALRAGTEPQVVQRVFEAHSAKAIVALCWRAKLAMSTAVVVQTTLGRIPRAAALMPREDGRYPISVEAMRWQLEFFGIAPPEGAPARATG
jgi:uncharacterized protein (DUF2336 family)